MLNRIGLAMKLFLLFANRTPEAREFMKGWNKTIAFDVDGKDPFHIVIEDGKASYRNGKPDKYDVLLKVSRKVLTQVLAGRIEMDQAFAERQFEVVGPIVDGVKFRHLSAIVERSHIRTFSILRKMPGLI